MSRVEEAMRRASELAGAAPLAAATALESADLDDDRECGAEPFPIEMQEHRRPRAVPPPSHPAPPPAQAKAAAPMMETPRPTSLIERLDARLAHKVVVDGNISPVSREQYRRLAGTLHQGQAVSGLKVIMVASAVAGEGKTLTAANLALTFSESYRRNVLLIDADLRRPSLHTLFNVDGAFGLSDGLTSPEQRTMAVRQVSDRLAILTAGKRSADPMAGLTSNRMRDLIAEAREGFDWVILDTPPIGLLPDANLLASWVDGVLMIVKADATPHQMVKRAIAQIGPDRVLGVVLNRATTPPHASRFGYGYDYYGTRAPEASGG